MLLTGFPLISNSGRGVSFSSTQRTLHSLSFYFICADKPYISALCAKVIFGPAIKRSHRQENAGFRSTKLAWLNWTSTKYFQVEKCIYHTILSYLESHKAAYLLILNVRSIKKENVSIKTTWTEFEIVVGLGKNL